MNEQYNPQRLNQYKEGIVGLYIEQLQEIKKGKIPVCFGKYADFLRAVIPYFPKKEQRFFKKILEAGIAQVAYLRAADAVKALKISEDNRLETIDDFLKSVEQ